jgi:hypothetical protein
MPASISRSSHASAALRSRKGAIAQIVAVVLDQIEGIEDSGSGRVPPTQLLESGQTVGPQYNRLAVDREGLRLDPLCGSRDRWQSRGPVIGVAGVEPNYRTVPAHD